MTHAAILAIRLVGLLPLPWVRALGSLTGNLLWILAARRRAVVATNLDACFPELPSAARGRLCRAVFVRFAQAWMDRGWLWDASPALLRRRLKLSGRPEDVQALTGAEPLLIFAPHFVGLDAGWTALALYLQRPLATLYTRQSDPVSDRWVARGRGRLGQVRLYQREDGPKPLLAALRQGALLYLLPDMDFGARESIFVPFFGVQAATVTSLSRFAKLGRAKVLPVLTWMTDDGYEARVFEAWRDFPSADTQSDTLHMNRWLEDQVRTHPEEYYWLHRRLKTRPPGEPALY